MCFYCDPKSLKGETSSNQKAALGNKHLYAFNPVCIRSLILLALSGLVPRAKTGSSFWQCPSIGDDFNHFSCLAVAPALKLVEELAMRTAIFFFSSRFHSLTFPSPCLPPRLPPRLPSYTLVCHRQRCRKGQIFLSAGESGAPDSPCP